MYVFVNKYVGCRDCNLIVPNCDKCTNKTVCDKCIEGYVLY